MGPTGVGKTALAIRLAESLPIEIISVDSAMVYQGMDIGTAKPSIEEQAGVRHHLLDCCAPDQAFSVGVFCDEVPQLIESIQSRGHIPLLVGGTMMYFHALQQGLASMPDVPVSVQVQVKLMLQEDLVGAYAQLQACDPVLAKRLHPNDSQRIGRGLEIFLASGSPLSQWQSESKPSPYRWQNIAVVPDCRDQHRVLLAKRFQVMLAKGFEQEVHALIAKFPESVNKPSMRSVGYQQMLQFINGALDFESMQSKAIVATCRLAKRQMTWLRSWSNCAVIRNGCDELYSKVLCALQ